MAEAPLLGGCVPVALGAPRLAGLSGAPLLPMVVVRERDHGYRIAIGAPLEMDSRQTADQRSVAAAAAYFRRLEPWVREYPEQWRGWSKWRPL
jgi:lauroyl/myristoyl acyltransferase